MTATVSIGSENDSTLGDPPAVTSARWRWLPWAVLGLSAALFVYGEQSIPYAGPSEWGLIGASSPAYASSILFTATAFAIAVRQANIRASVVATLTMIVVLQLPRSTATDMPMYAWVYKHLGVVDYIQHSRALAHGVDIYNGWPGLFALTAWFSDLTGLSPTTIAHWWIPCFHVVFVVLVYGVARAWGLAELTAVTAAFLAASLNWVEQDYFSPQSITMLFAAAILALVGLSRNYSGAAWLVIVLFAAADLTHQLTPYWLLLMIVILVVSRKMKPWWIVLPLAVMVAAQLAYNWDQVSHFTLFSGDILANTETNVGRWHFEPTMGQRIVSIGNKVQASSLWLATGLVLLVRWRKKQPFWALGVMALCGLLILGGQDYGGEAIFRVYLYCLIGCCVVLAPALVAILQGGLPRYLAGILAILVSTSLAVMGNSGSWFANVMPKEQVEASRIVLGRAELPAYLTPVAPTWPERITWRYIDYVRFQGGFDYPMIYAASLVNKHFDTDADYGQFVEALNTRSDASTYLIMTDQMQVYCWYFGILPWDALPNLKQRLYHDQERWAPFYDGNGITVFVHKVAPSEGSTNGSG